MEKNGLPDGVHNQDSHSHRLEARDAVNFYQALNIGTKVMKLGWNLELVSMVC